MRATLQFILALIMSLSVLAEAKDVPAKGSDKTHVRSASLLQVVSTTPLAQAINGSASQVTVTFNNPIVPASVSATTFRVWGRWSGAMSGTFTFMGGNTQVQFDLTNPISAGEWVMVALSKNIQSTIVGDTFPGFVFNYWVDADSRPENLVEIEARPIRLSGEGTIRIYGGYAGDIDKDGFSDLALINEDSDDCRLLLNDGTGGYPIPYTTYDYPGGGAPSTNEGADFNGDGWTDLAAGTSIDNEVRILFGDGLGGFSPPVSIPSGNHVRGIVAIDADMDDDMDIITANFSSNNMTIMSNDGAGNFAAPTSFEAGGNGEYSCAVSDANEDGFPDLFVGTLNSNQVMVLLNDGAGNFTQSDIINAGGSPWMMAIGDINGDGNVDVATANSSSANFSVVLGDGTGQLISATTYASGGFPIAIELGDVDGDNDLDVVTSCFSSVDFRLFKNDGTGLFGGAELFSASSAGSCAILHDRDRDGDLDMAAVDELDDILYLYENQNPVSCCVPPIRGNVNGSGGITVADLTYLVSFLFNSGPTPPCTDEANVNAAGGITVADLTYLVNFLFNSGAQPPACP